MKIPFTIETTGYASNDTIDYNERVIIRFELEEVMDEWRWKHQEFGSQPNYSEWFETPAEAYMDAIRETKDYASSRTESIMNEINRERLSNPHKYREAI